MKLKKILAIIIIFSTTLNIFSFVDKRKQWWQVRVYNLEKENNILSKKQYYVLIKNTLTKDIDTANHVVEMIENYELGYDEEYLEKKIFTDKKIAEISNPYIRSKYSLIYLSYILKNPASAKYMENSKKSLNSYTLKLLSSNFPNIDRFYLSSFINTSIMNYYYKYLSHELFLQNISDAYETNFSKCQKSIISKIKQKSNSKINTIQLKNIIENEVSNYFASYNPDEFIKYDDSKMNETWVISNLNTYFDHHIKSLKMISAILKYGSDNKEINKLEYFRTRSALLEKTAFEQYSKNLNNAQKYIKPNDEEKNKFFPDEPNLAKLFNDIDSQRKIFKTQINGLESENDFKDFQKSFSSLINNHLKYSAIYFKNEEKQLRNNFLANSIITHENTDNEKLFKEENDDFFKSKIIYNNKLSCAKKYTEASIKYLKWLSFNKGLKRPEVVKNINLRMKTNSEYISLIENMTSDLIDLSKFRNHNYSRHCYSLYPHIVKFINTISYPMSIENREKSFLTGDDIISIKNKKEIIFKNNTDLKKNIHKINIEFSKILAKRKEDEIKRKEEIKKHVAQYEIDILSENIKRYYNKYSELNYAESVFADYSLIYNQSQSEGRKGVFKDNYNKILKEGSVFSVMKNFDIKRLENEYSAKLYLKQCLIRDIAKIKTLAQFYRKQRIDLLKLNQYLKIDEINAKINQNPSANIASWKMYENNFKSIDRNAVKTLKQIFYKKSWERTPANQNISLSRNPDEEYLIKETGLKIYIPAAWQLHNPTAYEKNRGVIYKFINPYDSSKFEVSFLKGKSEMQQIVEMWAMRRGLTISQIGWKTLNGRQVYWNVSKKDDDNIIKIHAFEKNGNIVIISGKTTKKRFPFFNRRLDDVVNSISTK